MISYESFLRSIKIARTDFPNPDSYPFNIQAIRHLDQLDFHPQVTFIVGENGAGKSTLMEAMAIACGFNAEGGTRHFNFATQSTHSELHQYICLIRSVRKPRDGFFFRAESYYNLATNIDELDQQNIASPQIRDSYGGKSLHEQSHGEAFFATFLHRFSGNGLYILDEPEAALSPLRQLSMLARLHELVEQNSQFIISTHSPILMAYPNSIIYYLGENGVEVRTLEETDHYLIMKQFLNNKDKMMNELFGNNE
ncbi:AAA family ATPase [Paenibacillus bovis]|uniref:AAA family ATPase n=1 Tax=Paenibacillus bovis TaxID=1616788 RepID=A0A172ZK07_9BACL|nr:AAA family ATPase [Paenibacillus bovis]ANF97869.1 AAA family ATPase [Paenibacillus bovis]